MKLSAQIWRIPLSKTKLYLAGIGIAAFLGVIATLTFNFYLSKETTYLPVIPENRRDADMEFQKIHYTSTNEKGVKEWELTALSVNYFQDEKVAEFEDVDITFYSQEGRTFTLHGDSGVFNTETRDIQLSGNVIGTLNDGSRFRTESLCYKAKSKTAKTDDRVLYEGPQFDLEGQGMIMDLEKEKIVFLNDVRAQEKK